MEELSDLVARERFVHDQTMIEGPDFAEAASLMGDPARARMLAAMLDGRAWTATELALEAGVVPSTASSHLARLRSGGLITDLRQGRHRYFRLSGPDVGRALEALMTLSTRTAPTKRLPGPRDAALRHARSCYGHLAGTVGVDLFMVLVKRGWLKNDGGGWHFDEDGRKAFGAFANLDAASLTAIGRGCLDWSERREHLGGALGRDLLALLVENQICTRGPGRGVDFHPFFAAQITAMREARR